MPVGPASGSDAARARPSVLIVDDSRANRVALEQVLTSLDVDIRSAGSGEDALKELLQREYAVVLMDVQMPGLDGFATTELIRQRDRTRHTPLIFVTARFADSAALQKGYALGALDFITKPFDEAVLRAKVGALVGHHRQAQVIEQQAKALRERERDAARAEAAREAAEAANRAKDEFIATLSHELRAPLNTILGWATYLQGDAELTPRIKDVVDTLVRSARAPTTLIDELLDVSHIVTDELRLDRAPVDLERVVRSALTSMEPAAAARQVGLTLSVAAASYAMRGDARRLEQLVCHLLANAIEFSPAGGEVVVGLTRAGQELRVSVADEGEGIDPRFLPYIFDQFRQQDATRTRRHGGLGIGLTLARRLAELHGGSIVAFSDGIDSGAELVVTLPHAAGAGAALPSGDGGDGASAGAEAAVSAGAQPLAHLRVLVVDDDEDARYLMATILEDAGAEVVTAGSAEQAVAAFATGAFEVLLSDIGMPGRDGIELVQQLRELDRPRGDRLVAVAVSGYGSAGNIAETRAAGFSAHVVKPFEAPQLIALLAALCASAPARR